MIVSRKYEFVFVAVPRTATTTIERALAPHLGDKDLISFFDGRKHTGLEAICARYPEASNYWSWAVLRNPWDQLVSQYTFWRTNLFPYSKSVEFAEWIRMEDHLQLMKSAQLVQGVDHLLKYERLVKDLQPVLDRFDIPLLASSLARSNSLRTTRSYKKHYGQSEWNLVAEAYAEEIELGGYGRIKL